MAGRRGEESPEEGRGELSKRGVEGGVGTVFLTGVLGGGPAVPASSGAAELPLNCSVNLSPPFTML